MRTVDVTIEAPLAAVWDALVDVRTYPSWLVGAQKIRRVDDDWPAEGSAFHHEVGLGGPFTIADRTRCVEVDRPHRLVLDVRARPMFHGTVTFDLVAGDGVTEVRMEEHPNGVFRLLTPVVTPIARARNRVSLDILRDRVRKPTVDPSSS
jgi:uncharacterized protein YndB with AHSA1/START domain